MVKCLVSPHSRSRSALVISLTCFSGEMPESRIITGTSLAGYRWFKVFLNWRFFASPKSRRIRSSSCFSDRAGFRSISIVRGCLRIALAQKLLAESSTGPLTPKWVKSISPNSRYSSRLPSRTVTSTFFKARP